MTSNSYPSCDEAKRMKLLCEGVSKYKTHHVFTSCFPFYFHLSLICVSKPFHSEMIILTFQQLLQQKVLPMNMNVIIKRRLFYLLLR